jgi:hypothetical protein
MGKHLDLMGHLPDLISQVVADVCSEGKKKARCSPKVCALRQCEVFESGNLSNPLS